MSPSYLYPVLAALILFQLLGFSGTAHAAQTLTVALYNTSSCPAALLDGTVSFPVGVCRPDDSGVSQLVHCNASSWGFCSFPTPNCTASDPRTKSCLTFPIGTCIPLLAFPENWPFNRGFNASVHSQLHPQHQRQPLTLRPAAPTPPIRVSSRFSFACYLDGWPSGDRGQIPFQ